MLCDLGADEVLFTHNSELIICSDDNIYRVLLNPGNLPDLSLEQSRMRWKE